MHLIIWTTLDILEAVLLQKSNAVSCVAGPCPVSATCCKRLNSNDEYSATLYQKFCCRTCPWLEVQHFGFTISTILERIVVLQVRVKRSHVWLHPSKAGHICLTNRIARICSNKYGRYPCLSIKTYLCGSFSKISGCYSQSNRLFMCPMSSRSPGFGSRACIWTPCEALEHMFHLIFIWHLIEEEGPCSRECTFHSNRMTDENTDENEAQPA